MEKTNIIIDDFFNIEKFQDEIFGNTFKNHLNAIYCEDEKKSVIEKTYIEMCKKHLNNGFFLNFDDINGVHISFKSVPLNYLDDVGLSNIFRIIEIFESHGDEVKVIYNNYEKYYTFIIKTK